MTGKSLILARIIWCLCIINCPIAIAVLGDRYSVPPGATQRNLESWPEDALGALIIAHVIESLAALVFSYSVWKWYWWFACIIVFVVFVGTIIYSAFTSMAITGVYL